MKSCHIALPSTRRRNSLKQSKSTRAIASKDQNKPTQSKNFKVINQKPSVYDTQGSSNITDMKSDKLVS